MFEAQDVMECLSNKFSVVDKPKCTLRGSGF